MTTMRSNCLLVSLTLLASADAFVTPHQQPFGVTLSTSSALNVGAVMDWNPDEQDEAFLMKRASTFAFSETCSLQQARMALADVIRIQSGCVSGAVLGAVCENVDTAAEIVANLREKITLKTAESLAVSTGVNAISVAMTAVLLTAMVSGMTAMHVGATPFTPEEWWWALRDGYLPTMLSEYFRNGGLATLDGFDTETTPFVMQEWWWALKGGYLNTMMDHYVQNGGLATVEGFSSEAVPFTPQELVYSMQGGYLDQLITQNVQNGGLLTSANTDTVALTPQEVLWAAKGGYLGDLSDHYFRNGGL